MTIQARAFGILGTAAMGILAVVAGWILGRQVFDTQLSAPPALAIGDSLQFDRAVVHGSDGGAVPLNVITRRSGEQAMIVFNAQCSSCLAEAEVWDRLERAKPGFLIVVAFTADTSFVTYFRRKARVSFDVWRCDEGLIKSLRLRGLPSIIVFKNGRVMFADHGVEATAHLIDWHEQRVGPHTLVLPFRGQMRTPERLIAWTYHRQDWRQP